MLAHFYLIWIGLFLVINITWDICSRKTPSFDFSKLREGHINLLYAATNFASGLILLISITDAKVASAAQDTKIPIIIAGFSGIIYGISYISPYPSVPDDLKINLNQESDNISIDT